MDKDGNEVATQQEALGMKVTIDIKRPDLGIVFDEVGCNLSQQNDHHVGGAKYVTTPGDHAYQSSCNKDSHFTCLGLTTLEGEPLLCVVIMSGKKRDLTVETGLDWKHLSNPEGNIDNEEDFVFFKNNYGDANLFPTGPTCTFKGKDES